MTNSLPTVGGSDNSWGTLLNNYLLVSHNPNGTDVTVTPLTHSSSPYVVSTQEVAPNININEIFLVDCTSGGVTITLPDATSSSYNTNVYTVKKTDSSTNSITVNTTSSQTIDGSTSATISVQYVSIGLVSDGSNWNVI